MAKNTQYLKDDETRIKAIALLIEKGHIKTWAGIFVYIPRTVVAAHLGINNTRMRHLVEDPSPMPIEMQAKIAAFLKVKYSVLSELTFKAMAVSKKKKG